MIRQSTRPTRYALLILATLAALAAGCSSKQASVTGPADDSGLAPLVEPGPHAQPSAAPTSWCSRTPPRHARRSTASRTRLSGRFGFRTRFRYRNALRGFAGFLSADASASCSDPRVATSNRDQVVHADTVETGATWDWIASTRRRSRCPAATPCADRSGRRRVRDRHGIRFTHAKAAARWPASTSDARRLGRRRARPRHARLGHDRRRHVRRASTCA